MPNSLFFGRQKSSTYKSKKYNSMKSLMWKCKTTVFLSASILKRLILWSCWALISLINMKSSGLCTASPCIRYSVCKMCKLWFCCAALYMRHLLHVCRSWEMDPSSVTIPEVSSIFYFYSLLSAINLRWNCWVETGSFSFKSRLNTASMSLFEWFEADL